MSWLKPKIRLGIPGMLEKDKEMNFDNNCPWRWDCSQHIYVDKFGTKYERVPILPAKMKLVESPQPRMRVYECGYCGMKSIYDVTGRRLPEQERAYIKNPAYLGGQKHIC